MIGALVIGGLALAVTLTQDLTLTTNPIFQFV